MTPDTTTIVDQATVSKFFENINVNKPTGPDGVFGRSLKFCCSDQLGGVFQRFFQTSVDTCIVPAIWKLSIVIPIPKKLTRYYPMTFDL